MAIEHIVIHKGTEFHSAFPHIIRLQNGHLLTVFRQAPFREGSGTPSAHNVKLNHNHLDPGSRIALVRSTDGGLTWDPETLAVIDASEGSQDLNMAMISQLPSGELLVNNHRWFANLTEEQAVAKGKGRHVLTRGPDFPFGAVTYDSLYFTRSSDNGYTWGEPQAVGFGPLAYMSHTGKSGAVELADGSLLLSLNGHCANGESAQTFVVRSRDGGLTWGQPSTVADDPEQRIGFGEPPLLRLPSGKLLTLMRTRVGDGYLYQAHSIDDGWVWQGVKRTPIWGFPCHLLRLNSGRILVAYGYRREPFGIRATISEDEGETWAVDREFAVRDDGLHRDLGYPASIQLQDGRILTTYYFHGEDGVRYIGGTIYSEEEAFGG